jgi:tRNA(Ile)-lysidine synthase TilS/MesJ
VCSSDLQGDSLCAFCSRFKRGLLYNCCRNFKYNKLVLAQHLDDLAESFMMSALHNGQIRTMKANYTIEAGDVRVIRPFVYLRETMTRDFSQESKLPIINENCPACFEQPKERARMKKLLMQEESMIPSLYYNLRRAFIPLLHDETYAAMEKVQKQVEEMGQDKRQQRNGKNKRDDETNKTEEIEPSLKKIKEGCDDGLCYELA